MANDYRIMVVDDSEENRDGISTLLKELGYIVDEADSGKTALEKKADFPPHLFIIDVVMPGMTGLELLQKLDIKNNMYEAIVVSAYENLSDAKKAMTLGAFSYLGKPVTREKLEEHIDRALAMVKLKKERFDYLTNLEIDINNQTVELKETLKILEDKDIMMDNVFNSLEEGILVLDNDKNIVFMNSQIQDILSQTFSDCAGRNISKAITDNVLLKRITGILNEKPGKADPQNHIYITSKEQEENQYYSIHAANYYNNSGKEIGKIFNFINESGKMKFERLKNSFLTIVSHELRTPLNIILNYLTLLKLKNETLENFNEVIGDMELMGNRLKYQINNVMSIARLTDSSLMPCREKVDILKLIMQQIDKFTMEAKEKNISIAIKNNLKNVVITSDSAILGIALNCLLSNAIKFNNDDEVVTIELNKLQANGSSRITIGVTDRGIGISKEEQKNLFESFVQVEDHMTRQFQGIGIGLFLVKRAMETLHGQVAVSSKEGKGSTFTLTIPLIDGESNHRNNVK